LNRTVSAGDVTPGLRSRPQSGIRVLILLLISSTSTAISQTTNIVDQFNPSGANGYSYSAGQIGDLWTNWFGTAFESDVWDPANDANSNAASGSMEITANFTSANNQFEVYDGFNGINPPINGLLYTNFQCDVRFAAGSATGSFGGQPCFGYLQFGVATYNFGQDYFNGAVNVPATDTNWVHVSIPINASADLNLVQIADVLVHIYGPNYNPALSGPTTLWVDNIEFTGPNLSNNCLVDGNSVFQRIDGFGASSAWQSIWNQSEANLFFSTNNGMLYTNSLGVVSTNNGIGLSLLRNRIVYANSTSASATPTTVEGNIMQMAQALGARVWSTPWTPAAGFKSTNDIYDSSHATAGGIDGGSFLGSGNNITNVNYASQLANYVAFVKSTYGVNLYAVSIQNEPDADVTSYEACQWSAAQIHDFVTNLYAAFVAKGVSSTKIILPEDENWRTNLLVNAMSDPAVGPDVGIVACHNYDGSPPENTPVPFPTFTNPNAATWETEVSLLSGSDGSMANAVYWAGRIHWFMTIAQANAWHYWWLMAGDSTGNESLTDTTATPTKRMFALGQFSRFVRPNYYRIAANNNGNALISAYKDTASPGFAIVAINPNSTNIQQTFTLTNFSEASVVTPWMTTSNLSLTPQSPIAIANLSFTYTLPAMSVVTFAGVATNYAPVLAPVPNQTVNPDVTINVTNTATDVGAPPQTLTFNSLPEFRREGFSASFNTNTGVLTWTPPIAYAGSSNLFQITVANNGTPALSATTTNSFYIIVNPVTSPSISSISVSGQKITLTAQGTQGPNYTLLMSTNLINWQAVLTNSSPALPLTMIYTNTQPGADCFFRLELGP
jgi:glucuronoarabinoxylan endo-1,4-beta-xylanase